MTTQYHIVKIGGKTVRIPEAEIAKQMKLLDLTREEAIDLYLEDNDYKVNEEVEALTNKARANKVTAASCVKARAAVPAKTQRERVKKDDPAKEMIIKTLAESLDSIAANITVVDNRKVITFTVGDDLFKLDLSRTRKKT